MLWGLGVGYVISGEYFGWNLGLPAAGTWGMLIATLVVTIMYVAFVLSYAELACAIPQAGGAFAYALRALGPTAGFLAGAFQLVEFVFAPPAIALAIGAYLNIYLSSVSPVVLAAIAYAALTALNVWGVRQAAAFELFVTVIAIVELVVFCVATAPAFRWENVAAEGLPHGFGGILAALPFAIWFYLGIEGVANAAEEARNPHRDIAIGLSTAMATLVVLALAVFFCATGAAGWRAIVYPDPTSNVTSDSPLPLAMANAVSESSVLYAMLVGIGLFGLVASFHGILLAAGRATMALGRARFAPRFLGRIDPRTGTPALALGTNMSCGIVALCSGRTSQIITLSVFGALGLYVISMVSLFVLRAREPDLPRPFRAIGYPVVPAVALVLAVVCLAAMIVYNWELALVFGGLVCAGLLYFVLIVQPKLRAPLSARR